MAKIGCRFSFLAAGFKSVKNSDLLFVTEKEKPL